MVKFFDQPKVYIGRTNKDDPYDRIKDHIRDMERGSTNHFHNAIRKYGVENMMVCWIHYKTVPTENIKCYERYYIWEHDSFRNGYNSTTGGDGGIRHPRVIEKLKETWSKPETKAKVSGANNYKNKGWGDDYLPPYARPNFDYEHWLQDQHRYRKLDTDGYNERINVMNSMNDTSDEILGTFREIGYQVVPESNENIFDEEFNSIKQGYY